MGHLRTGSLPRTKKWSAIVSAVGDGSDIDESSFSDIADKTLEASNRFLRKLPYDPILQKCFQFLIILSVSGKADDVQKSAAKHGLNIEGSPTKLQLSKSLRTWLADVNPSDYDPELSSLSRKATLDTLTSWLNKHSDTSQMDLFSKSIDPFSAWRAAANGGGFSELSRNFFANFTQRYLNYFLTRTASSQIRTLDDRKKFAIAVQKNADSILTHAFETSKLVQSFSAGWYNTHASEYNIPSSQKIQGFLRHSLEKIREEFRRQKEVV